MNRVDIHPRVRTVSLAVCIAAFAALTMGCLEESQTQTETGEDNVSSADDSTANDTVTSSTSTYSSLPAYVPQFVKSANNGENYGPLPDPWRNGPLPDPWVPPSNTSSSDSHSGSNK